MSEFTTSYQQRFGGIARLYGEMNLQRLAKAHMVVLGIGGVGTWVAEALARSGVGTLTLVDLDDICVTNTNRQIHTLASTIGSSKTTIMADRLRGINPEINIIEVSDFIEPENVHEIITDQDAVVDAIDAAHAKAAVIAHCKRRKIPMVTVGSAGGKRDPRLVGSGDLSRTTNDPLLAKTRNQLRRCHHFSRNTKRVFSVEAIYSTEQMVYPDGDGEICYSASGMSDGVKLDCAGGFGAATMITGTFGFVAASRVIDRFLIKQAREDQKTQEK
ncbi:tRNA cyclic N6-threonylcarbamoyladenosine(37) synthase TcdA [Marinibactrum halimedae]|uniref:tRNA cyclic N6-threonylcarbamoyladenosine(37) synthase TcdA n=1 Tax=Marinibactrum halimedae TaxID=1444977 RepID=A0AA37T923_9GAMM|nr:tRNA cyclic N6-threonylcarbamoyladenosine(37) synthase TcdA [Marinibactrum halimedae]MCD9461025.1 tRNA cyclic N6-threonylcarbamoyladenosine(37) synthase TcdA [Marinibactrum halimedae]GLS27789.1 tRNA cyclic N6-threonylcarbamoyladenosine(37) synthase TcdA [Marinibactrum halimedae]